MGRFYKRSQGTPNPLCVEEVRQMEGGCDPNVDVGATHRVVVGGSSANKGT